MKTIHSYQEKRISLKLSRLCLTINNDRIWLLWNNGGNSFKIHAGFFKISDYHTGGKFKPLDACHALRMSLSEDVRAMIPPLNVIKDESKRQNQIFEIHHISEVSSSLFLTMKGP